MRLKLLVLLIICIANYTYSQDTTSNKFGKGLTIVALDSSFSMKFTARFQTLYDGELNLETNKHSDKFMIRRSRLKFSGFAYDPRVEYKIELGISNRDHGSVAPENNLTANIIMDAVLKYKFAKGWQFWIGQTKLPGNRERVISSQLLQFVDRSQVNSKFTIDRGIGIQLHHKHNFNNFVIIEKASMAQGEGRNRTEDNIGGYEFTGRIEFLPFGEFAKKGDYFGSDLARESTPKLSVGITYDQNNNTTREAGFRGDFLAEPRDLNTLFIDAMFKYKGWSSMFEYAKRDTDTSPIVSDGVFYTGNGLNLQVGYLFKNNIEIASRYTEINPEFLAIDEPFKEYTLGFSKFFSGHDFKIQSDITYVDNDLSDDFLNYRFQVELSF